MNDKTKALDIAMSLIDCELPTLEKCRKSAIQMAEWKDQQFAEEKKDLQSLVDMLPMNDSNQTIIEYLKALLS